MDIFTLQFLLALCLIFVSFFCLNFFSKTYEVGVKNYPLLGILPGLVKNRNRFLDWTTEGLILCPTNTLTYWRPGGPGGIITANPLNVEHILKTKFDNYPKGDRFLSFLNDFLGHGIFNADGDLWKVQRKTASYEFNTRSLRNFVMESVKSELQERLLPLLKNACESNRVLDMQDILESFAFDNICKLAFNVDPGCLNVDGTGSSEFMKAFEEAAILSAGHFLYAFAFMWKIKRFLNVGSERKLKKSTEIVHRFADKIIKSRLERMAENKDEDLLSRFIGKEDNSPEYLRDIVISFILAGRDTTSSGLTSFFWLISSRPSVQDKILEELKDVRVRNEKSVGEIYSFDELREMHYLHAAISETMRLYPPVPIDTKASVENDILPDGTFVGKNWDVAYHTYAMGRMENIWGKDCLEFLPERWLENGMYKPENQFKFPVFNAGPRICLGKEMAYIQMKSIAASVIERFDILVENKCPEHSLSLTLRMKDGLHVRVKERCG